MELIIVMAIIGILLLLVAPAFTNIKSGTDVTSAAYTIKGVLDTALTYAKANNTYTWVGFYEEDVSQPSTNPATAGNGRIVMSIVASKDGTNVATTNPIDPTTLIQVGKLTKIDNAHLTTFTDVSSPPRGTSPGTTFNTRPCLAGVCGDLAVNCTYSIGDKSPSSNCTTAVDSTTPFQYPVGNPAPTAQYTFKKAVQFGSDGQARINNSTNAVQSVAEVGLRATHGTTVDTGPNLVAIQLGGVGGDVIIYRK